jgi:hypothetical protein
MNNLDLECIACYKHFKSLKSLEFHYKICIYNIYKKYNYRPINNNIINDIAKLINIFNLTKLNFDSIVNKNKILHEINVLYIINNANELYIYIYNYIYNNASVTLTYIDLINIISNIYHIPNIDILNIIKCCKESYNNISVKL